MTFAPPTLKVLRDYWRGQGGAFLGIVGDTGHVDRGVSYHLGRSQLTATAYYRRLFLGEDGLLYVKDSAGTVTHPYSGGGVATDPIWAAAGDLVQGTGNDAAAVLSAGASGKVLTAHGTAAALTWETPTTGGITRSTAGTTSAGASFSATRGVYLKKITLASDGLVASIWVHVKGDSTNGIAIQSVIFSDVAGAPTNLIHAPGGLSANGVRTLAHKINGTARWMAYPVGAWLVAGSYWIGVVFDNAASNSLQIAYSSGTGSDSTVAAGLTFVSDSSIQAISTGTNDYSIYADILR